MTEQILQRLDTIEKERDITILFSSESGSRGWGFPSTDSDYDVRFIYVRSLDWYLSLGEKKDQIDLAISDELDLKGWELRKALLLMKRTNVSVYEWLQSPIIYKNIGNFQEELLGITSQYYSPKTAFYHYHSMTLKYIDSYLNENTNLKKLFYILRGLFSCKWLVKQQMLPSMQLEPLLVNCDDAAVLQVIRELIELKGTKKEEDHAPTPLILRQYIETEFAPLKSKAHDVKSVKSNYQLFDEFFQKRIKGSTVE